jgi:hypothetical protein
MARAMPATTRPSSPSRVISPNAPWHRQTTASNSSSNGIDRGVEPFEGRPSGAAVAGARSTKRWLMSMPWTTMPRAGRARGVAAGPQPDVEDAIAGGRPSERHDVVDLLRVPFVNE